MSTPTLYTWAGGGDALRRLIDAFYDRVDGDDLVSRFFPAGVHETHRDHVAGWWAEVFGGPARYTDELGGCEHLVARHRDLDITPEARHRFVSLMSLAADDAGLPADPEFRSALLAHVECGSRLALQNSQPGAEVAGHDRRLLTARVATAAACVTGCGGGGSPADRAENGAIEPTSSRNEQVRVVRQTGPYRFVGAPIVVWWVGNGGPPPAYEVYFRLNRRLPDLKPAVQIRLDGLRAPSFPNGLGYEHDRPRRRCCAKGVNSFSSYLRSLFSGVPGQVVTVDIRVPGNRSSRMVARVPLRRMRRDDPAPGTATDAWFDVLGCLT